MTVPRRTASTLSCFWAAPATGLVSESQLALEAQQREVFPTQPFTGLLSYQGQQLALPLVAWLLAQGKLPGFQLNGDYQQ